MERTCKSPKPDEYNTVHQALKKIVYNKSTQSCTQE